ncbi:transcription elongation factor SPT4 [Exidia glandulosa HHB12029]|uniref:Transcription elongation factor SPT4 n=1 Tax=Exidia glandulosa HHB12029 TaxID=1314781 RepID=A0A165CDB2_EXIGL|nr:transcription elongation factor SPT4 [Exidia glandulosa HHB12029]KZV83273.1 transcription elongation factor SPT4 [Exidia glandulosa HHB12029]
MSNAVAAIPNSSKAKQLRACMLCSVIQTAGDFRKFGCPNCEEILQLKGNSDRIQGCTSSSYDGVIAVMNPEESWVARWQRTSKYVRGMYAVRISGRIPEEIEEELQQRNLTYRPRDGKQDDMFQTAR